MRYLTLFLSFVFGCLLARSFIESSDTALSLSYLSCSVLVLYVWNLVFVAAYAKKNE